MQPPLTLTPFTPSPISSGDAKNLGQKNLEKVGEIFDTPGLHGFAASLGTLYLDGFASYKRDHKANTLGGGKVLSTDEVLHIFSC